MHIESVDMKGEWIDLHVQLGADRKWLWWWGRNIPSFELFISPDWRGTQGHIEFDMPLYRYGNKIDGISLTFADGKITRATANENEQLLQDMIDVENANKIGEYSLTDNRFSKITKFMGETLYDENIWWTYGNTHIAVWMAYKDSFRWDESTVTDAQREEMGFNDSAIHTDIISTTDRTVTANLPDGSQHVIYENGQFTIDLP